jgi:hypothetical protein
MGENSTRVSTEFSISTVGIHQFEVRDLAGRRHKFANNQTKLSIYMVNQILYRVNDQDPINNQVFNSDVRINIISSLAGIPLYESNIVVTVTHNGTTSVIGNNDGVLTFDKPGFYSVKMNANTILANTNPDVIDAAVSSTYNFVIVDPQIAQRSFNIKKSTNFAIEKLIKIVENQQYDLTKTYKDDTSLIWLEYADQKGNIIQGNSIWDITLRSYNEITNSYTSFNFRVWINDESPIILSSIPEGSITKENISINYNAAQIYSQIGNAYITINDDIKVEINEHSSTIVETIYISEKGTHYLKIFKADGTQVSSYKFTKSEPINNVTKIILICAAIGVAVVAIMFVLLRRKGKYR